MMERTTTTDPGYGLAPAGHRIHPATRVGAVRLQVADLGRSLAYYRDVLGFRAEELGGGRAALFAAGATKPILEITARAGARPVPRGGRLGLYHFAILLPDRASLGRFVRHLSDERVPTGASDHLVSEALYLQDPDGLGIEVYADRPRSEWRHRDRQLVMATRPLDLAAVVAAGGEERWAGMPAGTTMGHVHLHVGDIDRAAAFYHEGLGLDRVVWSYPGALFLSAGGYHHHLGLNTWAARARPAGEDDARLVEWELVVPGHADVDAVAASLEEAGHAVARGGEGGGILARDPWGTAVRVLAA